MIKAIKSNYFKKKCFLFLLQLLVSERSLENQLRLKGYLSLLLSNEMKWNKLILNEKWRRLSLQLAFERTPCSTRPSFFIKIRCYSIMLLNDVKLNLTWIENMDETQIRSEPSMAYCKQRWWRNQSQMQHMHGPNLKWQSSCEFKHCKY